MRWTPDPPSLSVTRGKVTLADGAVVSPALIQVGKIVGHVAERGAGEGLDVRKSAGEEASRAEEGVVVAAEHGQPAFAGRGGERGDDGHVGLRGGARSDVGADDSPRAGARAEVGDREPCRLDGAVADQDADLAGRGTAPHGEVERHRLEAEPRGDLGGGSPFRVGGVGREDQGRAEAVGHAVAVLVQEEVAEIEQGGQVEGGWGGGGGGVLRR